MKHLKKFNESLQPDEVDELKDFCETSLAYLLDDGYTVSVSIRERNRVKQHVLVNLGLGFASILPESVYIGQFETFDWNDIKDYYIPFLQMLVRRYELGPYFTDTDYVCFNTEMGFSYLSLDQVINDRVGLEIGCRIWGISLKIVDKI